MTLPITFNPVAKRTYCRNLGNRRETWDEVARRSAHGINVLSNGYADEEEIYNQIYNLKTFPAGRWLWVGGTDWVFRPENHMGAFNCIGMHLDQLEDFRNVFDLCCQGCGVGEVLEQANTDKLPKVINGVGVDTSLPEEIGINWRDNSDKLEHNDLFVYHDDVEEEVTSAHLVVGDTRECWADAIFVLLSLATTPVALNEQSFVPVFVDLSEIRPAGTPIKGFGGVANPVGLPKMFERIGEIVSGRQGCKLTDEDCALIVDEGAEAVVAGNVRRSAGMKQFDADAPNYKEQLYTQDSDGNYQIDPQRQALRMSNHTKVYHKAPTLEEIENAIANQYQTGEGALMYAPASIARANADVLDTKEKRQNFIIAYETSRDLGAGYLWKQGAPFDELSHRNSRYAGNPCLEIIGSDFACNLSEVQLVNADPNDLDDLYNRFYQATLMGCAMLELDFPFDKLETSRQLDPIIGVGFTGWFDFCVKLWGDDWLAWNFAGRPENKHFETEEANWLTWFNEIVNETVTEYCNARNIKRPNRTTTIKPSGTLSQLSGACPGGHPSKAKYFIRRITFSSSDPVAKACRRSGYNVVPSQRCIDGNGNLLDDPDDPRVDEWLVEIPVEAEWAKYADKDWDTQELPAISQYKIAMMLQRNYAEHNVSYTIEFDEEEIKGLAEAIHQDIMDGNYISFAMMQRARADQLSHIFPRLPYEPVSENEYVERLSELDLYGEDRPFDAILTEEYQKATLEDTSDNGEQGCTTDKCQVL